MFLALNNTNEIIKITLFFILAVILLLIQILLGVFYIININKENHKKAEKMIAYTGYYSIASMIGLFLISIFGYKNLSVDLEVSYLGCLFGLAIIAYAPILFIFDLKQLRWIKQLDADEQKEYGINGKDRKPLIYIIIALYTISMILFGISLESYIYLMS